MNDNPDSKVLSKSDHNALFAKCLTAKTKTDRGLLLQKLMAHDLDLRAKLKDAEAECNNWRKQAPGPLYVRDLVTAVHYVVLQIGGEPKSFWEAMDNMKYEYKKLAALDKKDGA